MSSASGAIAIHSVSDVHDTLTIEIPRNVRSQRNSPQEAITGNFCVEHVQSPSQTTPAPSNNANISTDDAVDNVPPQVVASSPDLSDPATKLSATDMALLMTPLCLSVLLSSLDLTIITPAIPAIAHAFNSSSGYVWIGSAFILANTASTPIWGSVADIWGRKPVLLIALALFLAGSLLCALAPQMNALITGRAVQGLGSAGMGMLVNVIICDTFSLRDRGLYLAITSGIWAVGGAIGPIIGGLFATRLDWTWCFWINLPIGAVVFVVLLFWLKIPSPHTPVLAGLKAIDWIGSILIVGAALMVLLGLDFGDVVFPWNSATVISLIVFGLVTIGIFLVNEWRFASNPVIPLRLFTNRSTIAAYVIWAMNFYVMVGLSYYLPLYSQSVLGANALVSGIHLIPLIVAVSVAAAFTGGFIQKTGTYMPLTYFAHISLCLGTGLLINLKFGESLTKLIIFEILIGIGVGMNIEPPLIAAQAAASVKDTAVIQATMSFLRSLATTLAVVLGGVIFQNQMNLASHKLVDKIGGEAAHMFGGDGAASSIEMIDTLLLEQQNSVRLAYFDALKSVWVMFVVAAGLSFVASIFLRAHYLSKKAEAAVLGVQRTIGNENLVSVDVPPVEQSIELRQRQSNVSRSTSTVRQ